MWSNLRLNDRYDHDHQAMAITTAKDRASETTSTDLSTGNILPSLKLTGSPPETWDLRKNDEFVFGMASWQVAKDLKNSRWGGATKKPWN